jgi:LmbE family N-acetylglucosaminyl deacetylase
MNILIFAPHNDDEVLGVGGTIRKYVEAGHSVYVCEVTCGGDYRPIQAEAKNAHNLLGIKETVFLNLPVVELKNLSPKVINKAIGDVVSRIRPKIVFMPFVGDMHIDHREVTESVLVAVRPVNNNSVKTVYMYETLSETGWNIPNSERTFSPNTWIDITSTIETKIKAMECYQSQIKEYPNPRSAEGIRALAMYRGSTVSCRYAEAFMMIRSIIEEV